MRQAASDLPYIASHQARMRLTGGVALDDEEFSSVAQGAAIGLGGSFLLVCVWLFAAVRSWRLMVPIALTLVFGLLLTTGFAAVAVGTLNLISVAFAILFVGIAVDFAIQFTVRFRERRHVHPEMIEALRETGRGSGAQILVASLATASGFLAFTPTAFTGVAQLGIIAGGGMLIAFFTTLTFLPALLVQFRPRQEKREVGVMMLRRLEPIVKPLHWPILIVFVVFALVGAALTPTIPFDGDPLHTKNQHTEAVTTLNSLMDDPFTNPYTIESLLPSLEAARAITPKLAALPPVDAVLSLNSFVPQDQASKLAIIADATGILGPTLSPPAVAPTPDGAALRQSAHVLAGKLNDVLPKLPADDPLRAIAGDLSRLQTADDATLLAAQSALLRFLPMQLDRLRVALSAKPVTLADVPADLKANWMLPGRPRARAGAATLERERQPRHTPLRRCGVRRDAERHRLGGVDRAQRADDHPRLQHRRTQRARRHRGDPHHRAPPPDRRGPGDGAAHHLLAAHRRGPALLRHQPQLRQHHRAAAAARRRRLVQHLFHHELARWHHTLPGLRHRTRGDLLGTDHRHRVRLACAVLTPGNSQHGHAAADQPGMHGADNAAVRACFVGDDPSAACHPGRE